MLCLALSSIFIAVTQADSASTCSGGTCAGSSGSILIQKSQLAAAQEARRLVAEEDADPVDPETTSINTADLATTLKEMMEKIDASTTKGHNATSPDVLAAVNDMMTEFQSMAETKFKNALSVTQTALKTAVGELKAATAHLDTQKQATDKANVNLGACRKAEKAALLVQENCHT